MIVKCKMNRPELIADAKWRLHLKSNIHVDEVDIRLGHHYVVYGITFRDGFPWFYVCEGDDPDYLRPHFSGFFDVIDPSIPERWLYCEPGHFEHGVALLPEEWATTPRFYERLVDGNGDAMRLFSKIRQRLEP